LLQIHTISRHSKNLTKTNHSMECIKQPRSEDVLQSYATAWISSQPVQKLTLRKCHVAAAKMLLEWSADRRRLAAMQLVPAASAGLWFEACVQGCPRAVLQAFLQLKAAIPRGGATC
jgi:transposase